MSKHDEPNEYGFAGDPTAPEPPPGARPDEQDKAEEVAVPADDFTEPYSDAVYETEETEEEREAEHRR
ncbi:hypothetical protein DLE60_18510 [Micromonospora globispora]|uniref:Uncharacterized protein n=1 Tax=Micromonospora globispora TaxID=1450148 RepID=A0A317JTL3_9ACTN|nr:hypothetical protein [Micromonospora globispora]PWU44039.1 hypothetical protein DLJ46_28135 [Micromonospora globispora]PWU59049.1 hypothetical protein DLE60_18510 [Micromonospora globispora]